MTFWAIDPELFLHKGTDGVVRVRRCKNETTSPSSSMLMTLEDLKAESEVTDPKTLRGGYFEWDKTKYDALIDYIYKKHLLVNHQGSVIVELTTDDKAAPVVYIRALDILSLQDSYGIPDRTVAARTVKYLEDGKVAPTDTNSKETKLTEDLAQKTKEAAAFQQDLTKEKKKNKALVERVAELEEAIKNCGITPTPTPTVRIYTSADTGYSLTIRDGHVILGPNDEDDVYQYWVKDDKYGATVKDVGGLPSYALVNKFTGQALKPPSAAMEDVQLVPYNPDILDRSILWSEHEQGDGYRAIRSATHTSLNLDAFHGDKAHGGVRDGTTIKVGNWLAGSNQRWNIVPYCKCVLPTDPTPKETKLTEELAQKTKEAAAFHQDLTKEKKKNKALEERVAELEEAIKNCGTTPPGPPPPILKPTTYRVYTKADTDYSLTIRDGQVILGKCDKFDVFQYWIKDDKYGATVKDAHGSPSFALVNEFTGQAMKHPTSTRQPVELVPYNPAVIDESILWTERSIGNGYNTIRMVNNPVLMLDAFNGDQAHGGVRDGTIIKVWEWSNGSNQHWNIAPCSKPNVNQSAP